MVKKMIAEILGGAAKGVMKLMRESAVNRFLNRAALSLKEKARRSRIGGFFTNYTGGRAVIEGCLLYRLFSGENKKRGKSLKFAASRQVEQSRVAEIYASVTGRIKKLSVRSVGLGIIMFFAGFAASAAVKGVANGGGSTAQTDIYLIAALCSIASFPLIVCGANIRTAAADSCFVGGLMRSMGFCVKNCGSEKAEGTREYIDSAIPACAGLLLGISCWVIPAEYIAAGLLAVCYLAVIFAKPEVGVLSSAVLLPFIPTMVLAGLITITSVSFFFKFIRGRRVIRFESLDIAVLLFTAMLLYGGLNSTDVKSSMMLVALYYSYIALYFLIVNLIKTPDWSWRLIFVTLLSGGLTGIYAIFQAATGVEQKGSWVDQSFGGLTRVYAGFDNPNVLGEYLILLLPIAAALAFGGGTVKRKLFGAACTGLMLPALVLSFSRGSWLGAIIAFIFFALIYSVYIIKLIISGVIALPFVSALLPQSVLKRFMSIGDLKDTSTSYRLSIWQASVNMLKNCWISGIGVGIEPFSITYPLYALSGAGFALHSHNLYLQIIIELGIMGIICFAVVCLIYFRMALTGFALIRDRETRLLLLGAASGILAYLIQGVTDNIWYNFKIFLMFWLILGLSAAAARSRGREWCEWARDIGHDDD